MPYLTITDLESHLHPEVMDEITRENDTLITNAINAAVAEAKSYLTRYDVAVLFEPTAVGYVADENLQNKVKDLAAWHLVKLANPNVNLELFRTGYEDAIKWLERVQTGKADPSGWPYPADDPATDYPENSPITIVTNPKRNNHF